MYQNSYSKSHLPFVCIGTSAGTGSEVTPYAILTQDFSGYKKSVKGLWPEFFPLRLQLYLHHGI